MQLLEALSVRWSVDPSVGQTFLKNCKFKEIQGISSKFNKICNILHLLASWPCSIITPFSFTTETLALFVSHWIVQRISPSKLQADWLKLKASTQQYSFMQPFVI